MKNAAYEDVVEWENDSTIAYDYGRFLFWLVLFINRYTIVAHFLALQIFIFKLQGGNLPNIDSVNVMMMTPQQIRSLYRFMWKCCVASYSFVKF